MERGWSKPFAITAINLLLSLRSQQSIESLLLPHIDLLPIKDIDGFLFHLVTGNGTAREVEDGIGLRGMGLKDGVDAIG